VCTGSIAGGGAEHDGQEVRRGGEIDSSGYAGGSSTIYSTTNDEKRHETPVRNVFASLKRGRFMHAPQPFWFLLSLAPSLSWLPLTAHTTLLAN